MNRRTVINGVLKDFLGSEVTEDDTYNDNFLGLTLDDDEIEILTDALVQALEKAENESKN